MTSPRLTVEVVTSLAKFDEELRRAVTLAERAGKKIEGAFGGLQGAVQKVAAAVGVGLSVNAFADMILGSIRAQHELGLVAERAGLTGEELSKLTKAAKLSHTEIEDVAQMSAKLSKALLEAQSGESKQAAVLGALGIQAKDIARLLADPTQAVFELAKRINELPEGGTKAAAQLLILGRAGGTTSAFLKELSKQQGLVATQSQDNIDRATEFAHQLTELSTKSEQAKRALANALLPTLSDVVQAFADVTGASGGAKAKIGELAADGSLKAWARDAALLIATLAESLLAVGRVAVAVGSSVRVVAADIGAELAIRRAKAAEEGGSIGALGAVPFAKFDKAKSDAANNELAIALKKQSDTLAAANKQYDELWNGRATILTDALRKQFEESDKATAGPIGNADRAVSRAQADAAQRAALAARVAKAVKDHGGAKDDPTQAILDAALAALKANSAEEKAILRNREEFLAASFEEGNLTISEYYTKKQEAQNDDLRATTANYLAEIALIDEFIRTADTKEKRAAGEKQKVAATAQQRLAVIGAAGAAQKGIDEQTKALREFAKEVDEVGAKLLELQGHSEAAARIRAQSAIEDARRKFPDQPNTIAQAEEISRITVATAALDDATRRYELTLEDLGSKQQRIDTAFATRAISEIEQLRQKSAATLEFIAVLKQQLAIAEAAANDTGSEQAIARVKRLRVELEALAAQGDLVARKFQDIFAESFTDALSSAIDGTKSLSDAFRSMTNSIVQQISRIAAQNISQAIFGQGGVGGGLGGFASSLFAGGGGSGGGFGDLVVKLLGAAGGTDNWRGGPLVVGERGPEIVNLPAGAQVIPNHVMQQRREAKGSSIVNNISVNVPQGTSRESADQIALRTGASVNRSLARNG